MKRRFLITFGMVMVTLSLVVFFGSGYWKPKNWLETEDADYRRGKQLQREGRFTDALKAFERVTHKYSAAPEAHLEMGLLLQERLKDPVGAIYHYRQSLRLTEAKQRKYVEQLIDSARKDFIAQLPGTPYVQGHEAEELQAHIQRLLEENAKLQKTLGGATEPKGESKQVNKPRIPTKKPAKSSTTDAQAAPKFATHTVAKGDTLSSISLQHYKTADRWLDIFKANRHQLSNPKYLKIGQKLIIPK